MCFFSVVSVNFSTIAVLVDVGFFSIVLLFLKSVDLLLTNNCHKLQSLGFVSVRLANLINIAC